MLERFQETNYSGFSTSVRSVRLPFAMLNPLIVKNRQLSGGFAKSSPARDVGRTIKRGSGALIELSSATLVQWREKTLDSGAKIPHQTWLLELDRSKLHVRL